MPTIPTMSLPGTTVNAADVYAEGLFHPVNPPDSLEAMNGGLDATNLGGALPSAIKMQRGANARFYTIAWDPAEFHYAGQMAYGASGDQYRLYTGLSTDIFLPWTAGAVFVIWSAFLQADVLLDTTRYTWNLRTSWDGTEQTGAAQPIEWTRPVVGYVAKEERWAYVTRMFCKSGQPDGLHRIDVSAWAKLPDDSGTDKLKIYGARTTVLAIR